MGLRIALIETRAQRFYFEVRQRPRLSLGAYQGHNSRNGKNTGSLEGRDSYEQVTREQRQFKSRSGPVFPKVNCPIQRQETLNVSILELSRHVFFVTRHRVSCEPLGRQLRHGGSQRHLLATSDSTPGTTSNRVSRYLTSISYQRPPRDDDRLHELGNRIRRTEPTGTSGSQDAASPCLLRKRQLMKSQERRER
jgi:hypothetical protein